MGTGRSSCENDQNLAALRHPGHVRKACGGRGTPRTETNLIRGAGTRRSESQEHDSGSILHCSHASPHGSIRRTARKASGRDNLVATYSRIAPAGRSVRSPRGRESRHVVRELPEEGVLPQELVRSHGLREGEPTVICPDVHDLRLYLRLSVISRFDGRQQGRERERPGENKLLT